MRDSPLRLPLCYVDCPNLEPIQISSVFDVFEDIEPNRFYAIVAYWRVDPNSCYYYLYYKDKGVVHRSTSPVSLPIKASHLGYLISNGAYIEFVMYDYCDALNTVFGVL